MADGAGDGHGDEHERHGNDLVEVVEVDLLQGREHDDADVDEGSRSRRCGDDGRNGGDEHAGEEQDAAGERGEARATAGLDARGRLDEGRDGGGAGAGAHDGAHGVGEHGFLHLGHLAVLVEHAGAGGGAHEGADGVEHVDHAERDDERDNGEPAHLEERGEVELEERELSHGAEGGHPGGGGKTGERVDAQEDGLAGPVDDRGDEHAEDDGGAHAALGHEDDGEEAQEHGDNGEHHGGVGVAHVGCHGGGRKRAEEIAHHVEAVTVAVVDAGVGADADVEQHKADSRCDAGAHAVGDGLDDLFAHVAQREDQEHDAFGKHDDEGGLEGGDVARTREGGNLRYDQGEEAVEAHAGGKAEGLVGPERHADHGDAGGQARCQEDGVPQLVASARPEVGEQVRVQGDDVCHRHERREAGGDLGLHRGAVGFELKELLHVPSLSIATHFHELVSQGA